MKPEPLTKEKKLDLINLGYDIATDSEKTMIRERVELLLKEIEKEQNRHEPKVGVPYDVEEGNWLTGVVDGLEIAKDLIKKAFSGVVE